MDFWTLPTVIAPYLWGDKVRGHMVPGSHSQQGAPGSALVQVLRLPVQAQSVRRKQQVLRHVASSDVHQNVPCHHLHAGRAPPHATGAGEARPLHGAGTPHRLVDGEGEGRRGGHRF